MRSDSDSSHNQDRTIPRIVSAEQLAEILDIPRKTVLAHARRGTIPGKKIGRHWRFDLDAVVASIRGLEDNAQSAAAAAKREDSGNGGATKERDLVCGLRVPGQKRETQAFPPHDWTGHEKE